MCILFFIGFVRGDSMYGMVNQGIKTFIIKNYSEDMWTEICAEAKSEHSDFELLKTYDDLSTYNFVGAISKKLNLKPEDVLKVYGKYWVTYASEVGYNDLLAMFGPDMKTCLINLNHMHYHMGSFMPDIIAPQFNVIETSPNILEIEYISKREGLFPFVVGLFEGLSERYNAKIAIKNSQAIASGTRFEIHFV